MRTSRLLAAAVLVNAALAMQASAQVISNGGFELPPPPLPVAGEWQYNNGAVRDGTNPRTGLFSANLDNTSSAANVNVLQQTLPGTITPGTQYTLTYWAQGEYGVSGIGQAQLSFLNAGGGILPGSPVFVNIPASAGYVQYSQNFTAPANASALFLAFNAVTGAVAGASSHLYVDDVSFAPVPEPTTLTILGATGLGLLRRKR